MTIWLVLRQPVWLAEVDLEHLLKFSLRSPAFRPYSKFPVVERDFSLVVSEGTPYERIEETIRRLDLPEIQSFQPVDLFRGRTVLAGQSSLLLRVRFQSPTHTLTSEEIAQASRRVLEALESLGVRLRV